MLTFQKSNIWMLTQNVMSKRYLIIWIPISGFSLILRDICHMVPLIDPKTNHF